MITERGEALADIEVLFALDDFSLLLSGITDRNLDLDMAAA